jgi:hypothetical protein
MRRGNMRGGRRKKDKDYFHDYFTVACILHGGAKYLEEIKRYIIETYVVKDLLKLIKPTYSKLPLSVVNESQYYSYKRRRRKPLSRGRSNGEDGDFYLAFILRSEIIYLEQVETYIRDTYVTRGLVELTMTPYSKIKQYIVEDWNEE